MRPLANRAAASQTFFLLTALLIAPIAARSETSTRDLAALQNASLVYIATVRKDGNQSKPAPVWFVVSSGNQVLIETSPASWKARRIRRGSPAIVWIGKADGPAFVGKAEIVSDESDLSRIVGGYPAKYLAARAGFFRPTMEKFSSGRICAIRITPIRDLPDGYASAPGSPAPKLDGAP